MRSLKFMLVALGLLTIVSCEKDSNTDENNGSLVDKITLSASSRPSTRISYEEQGVGVERELILKWQKSADYTDSFSLYDSKGDYVGDFVFNGASGQTSGEFIQEGEFSMENGQYTAVFPSVNYLTLTERESEILLAEAQTYTDGVSNLNSLARLSATFDYDKDAVSNSFVFSHEYSYCLLDITLPDGVFPRSVKFTDGDDSRAYTINIPNTYEQNTLYSYIAIKSNTSTESRNISFEIIDQNAATHNFSGTATAPYVAGMFYNAEFTITPTPPAVITNYYEQGCVIDGVTYNKNTTNASLVSKNTTISANGVYFVEKGVQVTINSGYYNRLIIIGNDPTSKSDVTIAGVQRFSNHSSSLNSGLGIIYKNLNIDISFDGNTFIGAHAIPFDYWVMEDCDLTTRANYPLSYVNVADLTIKKTIFKNNIIRIPASPDKSSISIIYYNNMNTAGIESIDVQNNLVFSEGWEAGPFVFVVPKIDTPNLNFTMKNNTFVDYYGTGNGLVYLANANSVKINNNIFWASSTNKNNTYLLRYSVATDKPNTEDILDNVFFGLDVDANWFAYNASGTYKPTVTFKKELSDIFDGFDKAKTTFNKVSKYENKGSSLH